MLVHRPQRQWRPGAVCAVWPAGDRGFGSRFSGTAGRHTRRSRLGCGQPARRCFRADGSERLSVSAARSCEVPSRGPHEGNAQIAIAASGGQSHHVTGLWAVGLREELRHALAVEGVRKVESWTGRYNTVTATWPIKPFDPFFNANMTDDLAEAERLAALDAAASAWFRTRVTE